MLCINCNVGYTEEIVFPGSSDALKQSYFKLFGLANVFNQSKVMKELEKLQAMPNFTRITYLSSTISIKCAASLSDLVKPAGKYMNNKTALLKWFKTSPLFYCKYSYLYTIYIWCYA